MSAAPPQLLLAPRGDSVFVTFAQAQHPFFLAFYAFSLEQVTLDGGLLWPRDHVDAPFLLRQVSILSVALSF